MPCATFEDAFAAITQGDADLGTGMMASAPLASAVIMEVVSNRMSKATQTDVARDRARTKHRIRRARMTSSFGANHADVAGSVEDLPVSARSFSTGRAKTERAKNPKSKPGVKQNVKRKNGKKLLEGRNHFFVRHVFHVLRFLRWQSSDFGLSDLSAPFAPKLDSGQRVPPSRPNVALQTQQLHPAGPIATRYALTARIWLKAGDELSRQNAEDHELVDPATVGSRTRKPGGKPWKSWRRWAWTKR